MNLFATPEFKARVTWVACAGLCAALLLALGSFNSADWPSRSVAVHNDPPANLLGNAGAAVAFWTYGVLGFGVWAGLALAATALIATALGHSVKNLWLRATGLSMLVLAIGALHALWFPTLGPVAGMEAGMVPQWITGELGARFSGIATSLILLCGAVIGAIVAADEVVFAMPGAVMRGLSFLEPVWQFDYAKFFAPVMAALRGRSAQTALAGAGSGAGAGSATRGAGSPPSPAEARRTRTRAADVRIVGEEDDADADEADSATNARVAVLDEDDGFAEMQHAVANDEADDDDAESLDEDADADEDADTDEDAEFTGAASAAAAAATTTEPERRGLSAEELRAKIACLPVRMANAPKVAARDEDIPRADNYEGYKFPTLDLLEDPEGNFSDQMEDFVRGQAQMLEETLQTFQIEGEVTGIESGPVVTLYSVELAPGTRAARLQTIAMDIARALSAPNVRVIPNMVGRTAVGIEVPNKHKEKVRLKELMSGPAAEGMALPMFLGKDSSGQALVVDLARQPHMLIAGTTGSGKSVCMNTIIMSWLYTKRPDELKLCLVDPKMVEMAQFSDIPHLMCPVVTDMEKAAGILEWAVGKMEERYELLKNAGVRDIRSYNGLGEDELKDRLKPGNDLEWARVPKKLPYLVFVIDELADLMMQHKEVETFIVRIAQKARAVGMHLVLATQRPQANVVTGLIKSNMPCRVSFKVASAMDSRIVLDHKGGELLLGHGDMLVVTPVTSKVHTRTARGESRLPTSAPSHPPTIDPASIGRHAHHHTIAKPMKTIAAARFATASIVVRIANNSRGWILASRP